MVYSDFKSLAEFQKQFHLPIREEKELFIDVPEVTPSETLQRSLAETLELALAINTEKARSEMIITPLLLEVRRQANYEVSLFSGIEFNVNPEQGLNGYCDYLISRSPEQLFVTAPITIIVEAKNEGGLGQCAAAMFASQLFNQEVGNEIPTLYGAVITGEIWRFLQLSNQELQVDLSNFYIKEVRKILGILLAGLMTFSCKPV